MSIFTKALTMTALAAVMTLTAGAAPVKRAAAADGSTFTSVKKVIPEDYASETWTDIGTGTLRDDVMTYLYLVDNLEFPVQVQECDQQPGRYRLINAWSQYPLLSSIYPPGCVWPEGKRVPVIIDASDPEHVFVEVSFMGCFTGSPSVDPDKYKEGVLWSMAGDYLTLNSNGFTEDEYEMIVGKLRDGAITFPKGSILFQEWDPTDVNEDGDAVLNNIWSTVNKTGMFRLKLPGAVNVDVDIVHTGLSGDGKSVEYELTLQDDIAKLKAALIPGGEEEVELAVENIKAGKIASQEITGDGRYQFDYPGDGMYTLVCVPYTEDGVARYESYLTRTFDYTETEWKKMGNAVYTEGVLSSNEMGQNGFIINQATYEVAVEMNNENPQIFRLVNPYANHPYVTSENYDHTRNYYMEFDASDANRVLLKKTEDFIGLNLGYNAMAIWSKADRLVENEGLSLDEVNEWENENNTKVFGWIEDNVLRFPDNSLLLCFVFVRPDTWYWANNNGSFRVELPSSMKFTNSVSGVGEDVDAPVEYFTLDGMKVSGDNLTSGVYVVRQGSKVWKQIVK